MNSVRQLADVPNSIAGDPHGTPPAVRSLAIVLVVVSTTLVPATAAGQTRTLTDVLSFLLTSQAVQTADVIKDREAAAATSDTLARALLLELATLPIATSSGAFTYRFNPSLGTLDRLAQSFGPFLVDRAVTTGRAQTSLGVTYRYATFTSLGGRALQNGTFVTIANRFRDEPTPFDVDALTLRLSTNTVTAFGNLGVTDWLDIGGAAPIVRVDLSGERVNTYRGTPFVQARAAATAAGLGDIAIRAKARLIGNGVSGVASGAEVRLPTGNAGDLTGAGRAGFKAAMIGSFGRGPVDTHINAGATFGGVSRELNLSGALVVAATSRVTVSAETLVRRVDELREIAEVVEPHPLVAGVDTIRLAPSGPNATSIVAIAGLRWNVRGTWLVNAHVIVPATERGLTPRPVPIVSVDYSFTR